MKTYAVTLDNGLTFKLQEGDSLEHIFGDHLKWQRDETELPLMALCDGWFTFGDLRTAMERKDALLAADRATEAAATTSEAVRRAEWKRVTQEGTARNKATRVAKLKGDILRQEADTAAKRLELAALEGTCG